MDKNFLIQLTNNLYHLTLLFPKKEPLRYKIRELAGDILVNLISSPTDRDPVSIDLGETGPPQVQGELEVLDSFFEVAKAQNWVKASEILEIQKEYDTLKKELKEFPAKPVSEAQPRKIEKRITPITIFERQEKILEILKEKRKAQVGEFKEIFPEVTKRTLRRDFENLLNQGKIERIGERNGTFYQIKTG
jgi:hypothetical protein